MLLLSDMDASALHAGLGVPPCTPLSTLVLWDQERLRKIARWKAEPSASKDLIRIFAKLVLAFSELAEATRSQDLNANPSARTLPGKEFMPPAPRQVVQTQPVTGSLPLVPVPKAFKGKAPKTVSSSASAQKDEMCHDIWCDCLPAAGTWPPLHFGQPWKAWQLLPRALTSGVWRLMATWRFFGFTLLHVVVFALTWLPILGLLFFVVTLFSDPRLLGSMVWEFASWPTRSLRQHFDGPPPERFAPPRVVYVPMGHKQPSSGPSSTMPEDFAHPSRSSSSSFYMHVTAAPHTETPEWIVRCFAGQVGAVLYYLFTRTGARPEEVATGA